jgi:hypothetical protein
MNSTVASKASTSATALLCLLLISWSSKYGSGFCSALIGSACPGLLDQLETNSAFDPLGDCQSEQVMTAR